MRRADSRLLLFLNVTSSNWKCHCSFGSLAELHFQIGKASTDFTQFKEAIFSFQSAASVIELRNENLK
jgi:hypothetical protein